MDVRSVCGEEKARQHGFICLITDSNKFAVAGGADMHKGLKSAAFGKLLKDQPSVDYYLDEE